MFYQKEELNVIALFMFAEEKEDSLNSTKDNLKEVVQERDQVSCIRICFSVRSALTNEIVHFKISNNVKILSKKSL